MDESKSDQKERGQPGWYDRAWPFRKKITFDPTRVANTELENFPALVRFIDTTLKSALYGGHVAHPEGNDIIFVGADGLTLLDHELEVYDPYRGILEAWVRLPLLGQGTETSLYLYYGNFSSKVRQNPEGVWGADYIFENFGYLSAITVEVWARSQDAFPETIQTLVSQWPLLSSGNTVEIFDAGSIDDLNAQGFAGAIFDGRFIYFVPAYSPNSTGRILRHDTQGNFGGSASWNTYGLEGNTGYYGGAFDGRYVYFAPHLAGNAASAALPHGKILRYDTRGDFERAQSWRTFTLDKSVSYRGAAFDGRYVYYCPDCESTDAPGQRRPVAPSGKVLRYDTWQDFAKATSYSTYDAASIFGANTAGFNGAISADHHLYFIPGYGCGALLRYDTREDFVSPASWSAYDLGQLKGVTTFGWAGAIYDGRYIYLVPQAAGLVVRYDTRMDLKDETAWLTYDSSQSDSPGSGYEGAIFDGKYIYFIPKLAGKDYTNILRYDTAQDFLDRASWRLCGVTVPGSGSGGFKGGNFDGRYLYLAPSQPTPDDHGDTSCRILRFDTTGSQASFSLRYSGCGHNGGLSGARQGPSFLINTEKWVLQAQSSSMLPPGWHHLAGVYDGSQISLVVDGVEVCTQSAAGPIQRSDTDVVIGQVPQGQGYFRGIIQEVRISKVARSLDWLQTSYKNLHAPTEFCWMGPEEHFKTKG